MGSGANGRRKGLVAIALAAGAVNAACDGYIGVEGRVYEWVGAGPGDHGFALVDALAPLPPRLVAIKDAEVTVEPWRPEERAKRSRSDLWTERATTDSTGYFKTGTTAKPGRYEATITVKCDGYREVQHVFQHDRFRHQAVVILVRDDRTDRGERLRQ